MEPIGVVRGRLFVQSVEIHGDSSVGKLIESLNLPSKLNVIAINNGRRMSSDEILKDGATIKIVSLALGG